VLSLQVPCAVCVTEALLNVWIPVASLVPIVHQLVFKLYVLYFIGVRLHAPYL